VSLRGLKTTEESMPGYIPVKEKADDNIVLHTYLKKQ